ncbi:hypothetical protein K6119_12615 [Paracrocinitomix mangrovi]|uniref:hypothetical protein n=1 Tax=Paracrocinitomix mangrovi TaxID=2862509 RepID=UPI001C8F12A8|nr:hypothetical protein [Paracrocinitomix mangrovi]UKN00573.1 hypothetical protein K6119_12615 [Paracrocinitomix mangrovi]
MSSKQKIALKVLHILWQVFLVFFLTVLTQVGGLIYLLSLWVRKKIKWENKLKPTIAFIGLYLVFTFLIIPFIAPLFGREKINHTEKIRPTNYMTVLLNRNYVRPEMNELLAEVESELKNENVYISYLDANFPFVNGFPLLPHLSHNDGKKLDLSLIYESPNGNLSNKQKSFSGYGVYEDATEHEIDQNDICKKEGFWQYDFPKYMTFGHINSELKYSNQGTKILMQALLKSDKLGKVFIEPHLKIRMGLSHAKIRYQGCHATRHDDHFHIQL